MTKANELKSKKWRKVLLMKNDSLQKFAHLLINENGVAKDYF